MFRSAAIAAKAGRVLSTLALVGLAFAPCTALADDAGMPTEKVETVNVETDAAGAVKSVDVDILLKNGGAYDELRDRTELAGVQGEDDATFESEEDEIIWQARGGNVSYTGATDRQLPVTVQVTYRLDGRQVSAEEIAGKSGEVVIRYDYANASTSEALVNGAMEAIATPFTCVTALMLDGDVFSDVKVKNGKVIDDDPDMVVAGYAMPGLKASLGDAARNADVPDYFEVTAHVKDFALKPAMTVVTAGLMSDIDADNLGLGGTDGATAGLTDAMGQLKAGAGELTSGIGALADGADRLSVGADELESGAEELSAGLYQLAYGTSAQPGLGDMVDAVKKLVKAIGQAQDGIDALADAKEGLPAAASALETIAQAYPDEDGVAALEMALAASDLDDVSKASLAAIVESTQAVKLAAEGTAKAAAGAEKLAGGFAQLSDQAKALPEGVKAAADASKALYYGSAELSEGAGKLAASTSELADGAKTAAEGSGKLEEGLDAFEREGLARIVDAIDNGIGGLKKRINALSSAASAYDTFSGKLPSTPGSVTFVFETAAIDQDSQ